MGACGRDFDENKYMYFLIKNIELLRKYNEIWDNPNKVICINRNFLDGILVTFNPSLKEKSRRSN